MSALRTLGRSFLVLGAFDAAISGALLWRHGARVERWRSATEWSQPLADKLRGVLVARGGVGSPRVVAYGLTWLAVWESDGRRIANGAMPFGTDVAVGDFTGDGVDEIAVASESLPPDAPVSMQVLDTMLDPVTPNIGVLEGLEVPASVAVAPIAWGGQVVAADFRGCLVSLVPPEMAWEHCFPNATQGGDPYAVRNLAPVEVGGRSLVVAGRATGEVAALDERGLVAWSYRLGESLGVLTGVDVGAGAMVEFVGGTEGAFAVLDSGTGAVLGAGRLPGMVMAARPVTWRRGMGRGTARAVAVGGLAQPGIGGRSGYVAVIARDGGRRALFPLDGQVMDVAAADLDGDGGDEIVAVTGAYRLVTLGPTGAVLLEERADDPSATKLTVVAGKAGTRLIVAGGSLQSRRLTREAAPWWYAPLPAGAGCALVLALACGGLASLRYPHPAA
jgi:FG-GAP repeat protein